MTYFEQQLAEAKDDAEKMQICLEAVKNWYNLKYVPEKFKTVEMCNIAVKDNGYALIYVPEEFKTLDMCIEIVKQETWAFMVVPENLKEQVTTATGVQQGGTAMLHHEYESALEKAVKEIFKEEVEQICHRLITYAEIARRKGILALEGKLDQEKIAKRDLLETGLMLAVDGTERAEIKNYLDSWIEANCNNSVAYYDKILASIIKTGVLCIQEGYNPRIAEYKMTVLIPRELTPDSLMPSNEKYFRRRKMTPLEHQLAKATDDAENTFTDPRDGKVYKTVKIGDQVWMAENLAYDAEGSKCYDNNPANGEKYGRLYDWETAMKVCPPGWHLPSEQEWEVLVDSAGGKKIAGKKLKAKNGWARNGNGTDEFGFSALPGGAGGSTRRFTDKFITIGTHGYWWGSNENENKNKNNNAYYLRMMNWREAVRFGFEDKSYLLSVRCVKDCGEVKKAVKQGGGK